MALAPLAIFIPALTAVVLAGIGRHVPRMVADVVALLAALACAVLSAILLSRVWHGGTELRWMGGWHPRPKGIVLGIDLTVDRVGAGAATFAATLTSASLVYSMRYFRAVAPLYHALMLVFLSGMVGLCLTGDLFNMFVFFELMGVPAYALAAYKTEERGPLQGALNFAVTNSIGAFLTLTGIALLYGRTGALNLAQVGHKLDGRAPDALVVVALVLVLSGFLVKAAIVPFHHWLADAHATAPVPVCVLFSGIMVPLGLLAVARLYWTVFAGQPALHGGAVVDLLLVLGALTAVLGAVMCVLQRHLKRLLAFSTISHTGMFLVGLALLDAHGLTGALLYVLAHGFVKGALFMAVGIVGHRLGTIDEVELHGRGRALRATGALFAVGGLALASLPPFGPFLGKSLVEEAGTAAGHGWVPVVFLVASALTGGAVLRVTGGVFLGLGRPSPPDVQDEGQVQEEAEEADEEPGETRDRTPPVMFGTAVALLLAGLAVGLLPHAERGVDAAATAFADHGVYVAHVLGRPLPHAHVPHPTGGPFTSSYLWAIASVAGALLTAAAALYGPMLGERAAAVARPFEPVVAVLRRWHSGHVGDYVTWQVVGVVAIGWTLTAALT